MLENWGFCLLVGTVLGFLTGLGIGGGSLLILWLTIVLGMDQQTARSINPDAYLVAEVWEGFTTIADYYASGIPSIFNFAFGDSSGKITAVLRGVDNEKTVSSFAFHKNTRLIGNGPGKGGQGIPGQ